MDSVAIIVINRDRPDLTDAVVAQVRDMGAGLDVGLYVVEAGSSPQGRSRHATHSFHDPTYRGRYFAFNQGLAFAHADRPAWDYYWFVCNDIVFAPGQDTLRLLWEAMQTDPAMAAIGPGEPEADDYQGCFPKPGRQWHKASTIHGLAMLLRGDAYREVGYCSPRFHYSQGAGTEFAYNVYRAGWFLAYSDVATLYHAPGGSTYGQVVPLSRHEYQRRARNFAAKELRRLYGPDWDEVFTAVLPPDVEDNTFPWQKQVWETRLRRNYKADFPRFFRAGSRVKQALRRLIGRG
ncbi:hypothetical protein LGQ03_15520 [Loktanella sp. TSTF-M6]|uniref:GT2 family glycosyltransferase n=1 Tax=Loktanella gaetbuli TaxID=2881335 RepID=A0ABS8BY30_9RHOB|nr:hypothetical protein [Loktanella gaetbuli]MCB5200647.1 hypothetical protein [Loktanella gaetbuli]